MGSLNSGRLYKQAEAMTRHYKKAVLLIEHEQQAQTAAAGIRYRNGINATEQRTRYKCVVFNMHCNFYCYVFKDLAQVMAKLQVLTMNFPKLRLIWSPGAHYTAELFHASETITNLKL